MTLSAFTVFRTEDKPLQFRGHLLGQGLVRSRHDDGRAITTRARLFRTASGKYVWATDLLNGHLADDVDPPQEDARRANAVVWETVECAWRYRPAASVKLLRATTDAWHAAAQIDDEIRAALYVEVE